MARFVRPFVACSLLLSTVLPLGGPARAQAPPALVSISKIVRGGVYEFPPMTPFTYVLGVSCSARPIANCTDVVVADALPAALSWDAADVTVRTDGGAGGTFDPAQGVVTVRLGEVGFDSRQIEIAVRFRRGTPPGTDAVNTASVTAANSAPDTSDPVRVTALAASALTVEKARTTGPAQVDTPVTYRVGVTIAAGGTETIRNARFEDELPPGATFVSASDGGTYDAAANRVTWTLGDLQPDANRDVPTRRDVTVVYPSPTFSPGEPVLNTVTLLGSRGGGGQQPLGSAEDRATLRPQGVVVTADKRSTTRQLGPGQSDVYTLKGTAPPTTDLDRMTITDRLPAGLVAVQDGSPNLTGTGPAPVVTVESGGGPQAIPVTAGGGTWSATLPASTASVAVTFGPVPAGASASYQLRAGIPADGRGRDGLPLGTGSELKNCAEVSGVAAGATVVTRTSCTTQTVVPVLLDFTKRLTSGSSTVAPGGSAAWAIDLAVAAESATPLVQPVVTDCLPPGFDLVDPSNPAIGTSTTGFTPAPTVQRSTALCANGGVQVTWSWAVPFTLAQGQGGSFALEARVDPQATPGSFPNEATLTAVGLDPPRLATVPMAIGSTSILVGGLLAQGDRDSAGSFVGPEGQAQTSPGGSLTYVAEVRNVSPIPVDKVVMVTILPGPGDTTVRSATPRDSQWRPVLADGGSSPQAPVVVSYSTSANPCRPEVGYEGDCDEDAWTTTPPPLDTVRALKAEFGAGFVLQPGQKATYTWKMTTPISATPGSKAWASFAYAAERADNDEALVPSEPAEVGAVVVSEAQLQLRIVKRVNGVLASQPPGLVVPVGDPLVFTYEVTNTGTVPVYQIAVVDDVLGPIPCPTTSLAPGESMTCTAPTQYAQPGQHTNVAGVMGAPLPETAGGPSPYMIDPGSNRVYTFGRLKTGSLIKLYKYVNGQQAPRPPGPNIPAGEAVTFTYLVFNGGALPLDISVTDDRLSGVSCPLAVLRPGEQTTCTAPVQTAVEGAYVNVATATGQPRDPAGNVRGAPVTDTDRAYYTNTIAVTGSMSGPLAGLAGVLLAVGVALTVLGRTRRHDLPVAPGHRRAAPAPTP